MRRIETERQLPRLERSLKVRLPDGWSGEALDLSATGLRIRSLVRLESGLELELRLETPEGALIPLAARVAWVNPPVLDDGARGEFGVTLTEVPEDYLALLTRLFADAD